MTTLTALSLGASESATISWFPPVSVALPRA